MARWEKRRGPQSGGSSVRNPAAQSAVSAVGMAEVADFTVLNGEYAKKMPSRRRGRGCRDCGCCGGGMLLSSRGNWGPGDSEDKEERENSFRELGDGVHGELGDGGKDGRKGGGANRCVSSSCAGPVGGSSCDEEEEDRT